MLAVSDMYSIRASPHTAVLTLLLWAPVRAAHLVVAAVGDKNSALVWLERHIGGLPKRGVFPAAVHCADTARASQGDDERSSRSIAGPHEVLQLLVVSEKRRHTALQHTCEYKEQQDSRRPMRASR